MLPCWRCGLGQGIRLMFGKILVVLHVGLSLILATWALVLFTNRMDWPERAPVKKKEYDGVATTGVRPADARFRAHRTQLESHEGWRPSERPWYELQLAFLGNGATEANPVRQVDRGPDGNPIVLPNPAAGADLVQMGAPKDNAGQPVKGRDGQPMVLKSREFYNKEFDATFAQKILAFDRRQKAGKLDSEATAKLNGPRGLYARLQFETVKQDRLKDEYNEIRPLWLNTMVEYRNLEDLRLRLAVRLKELESLKSKGDKEGR